MAYLFESVQGARIENSAISNAKIANDAINAAKIQADAVTASEIAANAVATSEILDDAVTTAKLLDSCVTAAKIAANLSYPSNLTVGGDLTVNGTTTTINTQNLDVEDKNITMGKGNSTADVLAASGITLDGGSGDDITFEYNGSSKMELKKGASFYDMQVNDLTASAVAASTLSGALTGSLAGNVVGNVTGDVTGNADTATALAATRTFSLAGDASGSATFDGTANATITATVSNSAQATKLTTARAIALTGDVSGSATFDGTAAISIAATIQPNSVAMGTDTTGDYVATVASGPGLSASGAGEAAAASVELNGYMQGYSAAESTVGGNAAAPLGEYFPLAIKTGAGAIAIQHAQVPAVIAGNLGIIDHQEPLQKHTTGSGNMTLTSFPGYVVLANSGSACSVSLPAITGSGDEGKRIRIKCSSGAASFPATILGATAASGAPVKSGDTEQQIDESASALLNQPFSAATFVAVWNGASNYGFWAVY